MLLGIYGEGVCMGASDVGFPQEISLEIQVVTEESYREEDVYQEKVVVKDAGWFSRAVTEMQIKSRIVERKCNISRSVSLKFCAIPDGTFLMGSGNEAPVHQVTISRDFYMGKYPVTQAQWEAVMGTNPSQFKGDERPVEQVSWNDCQEFITRLNATGNGKFRLPTEAEWEYACRAGSSGIFCYGNDECLLGDYAWYSANSDSQTQPVGRKKSNAWGLHDIHGNVWEWCQDWYDDYSVHSVTDPLVVSSQLPVRVFRGGCWRGSADFAASAHRSGRGAAYRHSILGFRLVCSSVR
jgi:formylglycine-generating enzyme required for sulfatase activity